MTRYVAGQWNAICDRCGFKFKSGELKKDWQGLMVCEADFETRHPQDLIRIKEEKAIPTWTRPQQDGVFLLNESFLDTFRVSSGEGGDGDSQDYIDDTYFAEDYIIGTFYILLQYSRVFQDSFTPEDQTPFFAIDKSLSDSVAITDSLGMSGYTSSTFSETAPVTDTGFITVQNYIANDYFADDYVLDSTYF